MNFRKCHDSGRHLLPLDAIGPAIAKLLLQLSAGTVEPSFVEKGAELVWARHPDHHRGRVSHRTKTLLAFSERVLRLFAECDVAGDPPCEGRFAMFCLTRRCHDPPSSGCFRPAE